MPTYALSYTPPPSSPLARFGAGILGYDCFEGVDVAQRTVPGIEPALLSLLTLAPRRVGLQANIVPPFSCHARAESELRLAAVTLAHDHHPILLGPLTLAHAGGFIVLRAKRPSVQLQEFSTACRAAFAPFAAAKPADGDGAGDFAFQMTLAGPADAPDALMRAFAGAFERLARDEVELGTISLMRQDDPAARFHVLACTPLTGH